MRHSRLALLLLAALLPGAVGPADGDDGSLVAVVASGNLLELDDGRLIRLAGIRLPIDGQDDPAGRAARAQTALAALVARRVVRLEPPDPPADRHGRLVAQVWRDDGLWLQGALLEQGVAQVQTRPGEVARAAEMAEREDVARAAMAGVWADPGFGAQSSYRVARLVGGFAIVRGRVVRAAPTERYTYLNFGADWRSDFTLRVARSSEAAFRTAGIDLEQLAGREVEVRGYVLEAGGPLIELSHPEQIRILRRPES